MAKVIMREGVRRREQEVEEEGVQGKSDIGEEEGYYFTKGHTRNLVKSLIPLSRSSCEDYKYHKISCRKLIITEIIAFSNIKISVFFLYFKQCLPMPQEALLHSYVGPVVSDHMI